MALNPQLMLNGMPIPFVNEMFVLVRDGVEFEVDKIPGGHGGHVKAKGVIYLSNIRLVFVASKPVENFVAFDMPLLYIHAEKFNQPIFHCNNISGQVEPVVPENEHRALYSTHSFKILFKEGGCGTFVPLFLNLISSVRQYNRQRQQAAEAAASNQFFAHGLPPLAPGLKRQRRSLEPARAFKDEFFKIKLPKIAERPEWWWRTLACVPYLISLQISDVGFYVQPFLEKYQAIGDMIYFIPGAINRWPSWFFMLYCYLGYMFVVKNKELPHYFRFHMMLGMLLETALQIIWCTSNFFPLIHFKGRFGMYYWMAIGLTYICLLLECIRCALAGVYAQVPFVTDAASIHTLFNLGGFSRPLR